MARNQAVYRVKKGEEPKRNIKSQQLPNNYTGSGRTTLSKIKKTPSNTVGRITKSRKKIY